MEWGWEGEIFFGGGAALFFFLMFDYETGLGISGGGLCVLSHRPRDVKVGPVGTLADTGAELTRWDGPMGVGSWK